MAPYREAPPADDRAHPRVRVTWVTREPPLVAGVALARDGAARKLAQRLLRASDEDLARWRGVAGEAIVAVMGERETLPWVDGVTYLGRDPAAPSLWLPTTARPDVPLELFERALLARASHVAPPLAPPLALLVHDHGVDLVSLAEARPIARAVLTRWLDGG